MSFSFQEYSTSFIMLFSFSFINIQIYVNMALGHLITYNLGSHAEVFIILLTRIIASQHGESPTESHSPTDFPNSVPPHCMQTWILMHTPHICMPRGHFVNVWEALFLVDILAWRCHSCLVDKDLGWLISYSDRTGLFIQQRIELVFKYHTGQW